MSGFDAFVPAAGENHVGGQAAGSDGGVSPTDIGNVGSGTVDSPFDGQRSFDFTLNGPMWWEFAIASNAYGRGVRKIFVPGAIFCTVISLILLDIPITTRDDLWTLIFCLVLTGVCWSLCGGVLPRRLMMNQAAGWVSVWFPIRSTSGAEMRSAVYEWKDGNFDDRWSTPSRLVVDSDGLMWMWTVEGDDRSTSVRWSDLDCVRLTEHAVVFSPSAGGKASMDIIPAVPDVQFMDLAGCVMVDRSVVPDLDGFVAWCRERVKAAARGAARQPEREAGYEARHSSGRSRVRRPGSRVRGLGRLSALWGRFRRWLYGDDEFLDGPPKNWLNGLVF
ncbi:hypothetical protein [Bifidobacterium sp. ESL0790]|uniref:hypothetical protein n=1 Tax=Bifidobacterium sp. ESL0790 TaxID=2983233 RepID=UPI0023F82731|nr:hypothetical protein [Bifidobacterium sp. ESL0790]WEV72822.1 hypothetical protein OZY47_02305 [Bifidobacterium sp. ESL0790]